MTPRHRYSLVLSLLAAMTLLSSAELKGAAVRMGEYTVVCSIEAQRFVALVSKMQRQHFRNEALSAPQAEAAFCLLPARGSLCPRPCVQGLGQRLSAAIQIRAPSFSASCSSLRRADEQS